MKQEILKELHYQPCSLSAEEIANPEKILPCFFIDYPLQQTRLLLLKMYKGWVYHASESPAGNEMADMLLFQERLITLIEATYIIGQQQLNNASK
jgi:hypothetical protein